VHASPSGSHKAAPCGGATAPKAGYGNTFNFEQYAYRCDGAHCGAEVHRSAARAAAPVVAPPPPPRQVVSGQVVSGQWATKVRNQSHEQREAQRKAVTRKKRALAHSKRRDCGAYAAQQGCGKNVAAKMRSGGIGGMHKRRRELSDEDDEWGEEDEDEDEDDASDESEDAWSDLASGRNPPLRSAVTDAVLHGALR